MGSGDGSLNQMTMSNGCSGPGALVSQGSFALLPNRPDMLTGGGDPGRKNKRKERMSLKNNLSLLQGPLFPYILFYSAWGFDQPTSLSKAADVKTKNAIAHNSQHTQQHLMQSGSRF